MTPEMLTEEIRVFLNKLGVGFDSVSVTSKQRTILSIQSEDSKLLIGQNGEHLQAINTLFRRLVEKKFKDSTTSFLVDVNNYHESKMEKVRQSAQMLAQKARLFKHAVEMEPMSSYERLVVHELFAEDPQIETASEGEGKFRHIVLKYKS